MAFPLEDSSEQRVSIIGSVPGEGQSQPSSTPESTSESPVTTTFTPTTEEPVTTEDSEKKLDDSDNQSNENNPLMIGSAEEDDEKIENGEEKTNPRLVFIERLMGLHLSAPFNGQPNENEKDDNSASESEPQMPFRFGDIDNQSPNNE